MVFAYSCDPKSSTQAEIKGKIENASGKTINLEILSPGNTKIVATTTIDDNGNFSFTLDSIPNSFHRLKIDDDNIIFLRITAGDEINITAKYPDISRNYIVEGSEECKLLKNMNARLIESSDKLNNLNTKINEALIIPDYNMDSLWNTVNETARKLYTSDKDYLTDFIYKNNKSAVIYMALYQYIGTSPILIIENDTAIFSFVLNELKKHHPNLEQTAFLESEVSKNRLRMQQMNRDYISLKPGVAAPDFVMPGVNSEKITLKSFRGKNVIIGFWSSWSKMSVKSVTKLLQLENKTDLEIILISLDTNADDWKLSIKNNKLDKFTNVCDLKNWEGSVVKIYGIKNLPSFLIIDTDGNIKLQTDDPQTIIEVLK